MSRVSCVEVSSIASVCMVSDPNQLSFLRLRLLYTRRRRSILHPFAGEVALEESVS